MTITSGAITICGKCKGPIPVAARSKRWVCGLLLAGTASSNPAKTWMYVSFECFVLLGRGLRVGLIIRPKECGVPEFDCEFSIMMRPWPIRVCCAIKKNKCNMAANGTSYIYARVHLPGKHGHDSNTARCVIPSS